MTETKLKLATESDIPVLHSLVVDMISSMDIYDPRSRKAEIGKYTQEYLNELIAADARSIIISWEGDAMSGFLVTKPDDDILWLCWFGVFPRFRGKGIGKALIGEMFRLARERRIRKIWCDTRANNHYSIRIMERSGFEKICELKEHWFNQDYFLWEKFLFPENEGMIGI